jgi:H+-transporting ATPase
MAVNQIHDFVEAADGFAEVFPEHKYQVVKMLQSRGHLTAMTGDGTWFNLYLVFLGLTEMI